MTARKPQTPTRSKVVFARLTQAEHRDVVNAAVSIGVSISTYARMALRHAIGVKLDLRPTEQAE